MRAQGPLGWFRGRLGCGEGTGGALEGPWPGGGPGGPHWNTHIGILLIQVFVRLLQDVVGVSNLLPDVHGLGRRGGQFMPTPPWASWFCPHHVGRGLRDLAFLAGSGEANGDRTWKGLTGDQPSPPTFIQLPARVWGRGRAELPCCPLSHGPRGTPASCSCGHPHPLLGVLGEASYLSKAPS